MIVVDVRCFDLWVQAFDTLRLTPEPSGETLTRAPTTGKHREVGMVVGALGFVALMGLLLGAWPVVAKQMRRPARRRPSGARHQPR